MKIDSFSNLAFQAGTQTQKVASSAFSFIKELSTIRNYPKPLLFTRMSFESLTPYPEELDNDAKIDFPDLNIHAWGAENKNLNDVFFVKKHDGYKWN